MTTPITAHRTRSYDDANVQCSATIRLANVRASTGSGNSSSSAASRPTTGAASRREEILAPRNPDTVELHWVDRYSQRMFALACTFLGVSASALTINGFNDQPAMRVPLMVTTISAWFALLFLSLSHIYSLQNHEWTRMRRIFVFPAGFLALSGFAFIVAFLAAPWTPKECDSGCRMTGVVAERVLVTAIVAAGLGAIYSMQRSLTGNIDEVHHIV